MNALHEAKQRVQDAYYDKRGMADVMRQDAAIYAAIAQAEAIRPRFVQVCGKVINLSQVAYIDIKAKDLDDNPRVEVAFASTTLLFGGEDYQEAVITLSDALYGWMVDKEPSE